MSKLLTVNAVKQKFQDGEHIRFVLDNITFDISPGEKVAVVGSSGSGKTTLLHILSGLAKPSLGEVLFEGQDLQQMNQAMQSSFRAKH